MHDAVVLRHGGNGRPSVPMFNGTGGIGPLHLLTRGGHGRAGATVSTREPAPAAVQEKTVARVTTL